MKSLHDIEFKAEQKKKQNIESRTIRPLKEKVENADLYKPVSNKTMAMQEECIKYNFEAPLNINEITKSGK